MDYIETGKFLAALRKEKDLTQSQAAELFGVSPKTVSKWECGDALPEITMLMTVAEFYGVTVDEILRAQRSVKNSAPAAPQAVKKEDRTVVFAAACSTAIIIGFIIAIIMVSAWDNAYRSTVGASISLIFNVAAGFTFYIYAGKFPVKGADGAPNRRFYINYWFTVLLAGSVIGDIVTLMMQYTVAGLAGLALDGTSTVTGIIFLSLFAAALAGLGAIYPATNALFNKPPNGHFAKLYNANRRFNFIAIILVVGSLASLLLPFYSELKYFYTYVSYSDIPLYETIAEYVNYSSYLSLVLLGVSAAVYIVNCIKPIGGWVFYGIYFLSAVSMNIYASYYNCFSYHAVYTIAVSIISLVCFCASLGVFLVNKFACRIK